MDLANFENLDGRRLEVVADGLPLHGGAQLAIDTTMVSPLHNNGVAKRASSRNGLALEDARKRKEITFPELAGEGGRARLVVLATEVGGRWSSETAQFLSSLAWAKTRDLPEELQGDAARAWTRRWQRLLNCAAAKAFGQSLLDVIPNGSDERTPSVDDVICDDRQLLRRFATELKENQELQGLRQKRLHCAQGNLPRAHETQTGHRMNKAGSQEDEGNHLRTPPECTKHRLPRQRESHTTCGIRHVQTDLAATNVGR